MLYRIKALREPGGIALIQMEAPDRATAAHLMENQGYCVLSIKSSASGNIFSQHAGFPLLLFCQELLALLKAGLTLVEGIETITEKRASQAASHKILAGVLEHLYQGRSLSAAMKHFPEAFPAFFIAAIQASEHTGGIPEALDRHIRYQTKVDQIRKHVISVSVYPAILLTLGMLVTVFLLTFVVPRFSQIYADMGSNMPAYSSLLLAWGHFFSTHEAAIVVSGAVALLLVATLLSKPSFRHKAISALWQLPGLGERLHMYQLTRLYRSLGMLLRSGIPVLSAISMSSELLQSNLKSNLAAALQMISEGRPVSEAMSVNHLTTPVAARMLRIGERSGQMAEMMENIAEFYDDDLARWLDWFVRLFEPAIMALMGLVIGTIVILMYMPVFELADSLQ